VLVIEFLTLGQRLELKQALDGLSTMHQWQNEAPERTQVILELASLCDSPADLRSTPVPEFA
jgi:hypothetical protein